MRKGKSRGEDVEGYSVERVMTDSRVSLYSRWGDWFPAALSVLTGVAFVDAFWRRWRRGRELEAEERAA